jgi:hypothetical protein
MNDWPEQWFFRFRDCRLADSCLIGASVQNGRSWQQQDNCEPPAESGHPREEDMAPLKMARTAGVVTLLLGALALPVNAGAQEQQARVRVLHLSPDAPKIDVYVDGTKTQAAVPFKTATKHAQVPAGTHTVELRPAGSATGDRSVASARATVAAGAAYTLAAVGPAAKLQLLVLKDDFTAPPPGKAKIRGIDAAPQSPPIDIAIAGGSVLFRDLTFPEATPFATIDAGSMALEVRMAGTDEVVFRSGARSLPAGAILTVAGTVSPTGTVEVLPILDAAGARTTPRGGIATGAGGSAPVEGTDLAGPLAATGLALVMGAAIVLRRRRRGDAR